MDVFEFIGMLLFVLPPSKVSYVVSACVEPFTLEMIDLLSVLLLVLS